MDQFQWRRAQDLFHEAVALKAEARERFVNAACGEDSELKELISGLLERDQELSDSWERELASRVSPVWDSTEPPKTALPPQDLGPYRFVRFLGQGGMGTVYQAEHKINKQPVAIKVLRVSELSAASRERFATEQRALARLNHPGIARLYASETFPDGTPCFVMEYVEGQPLTTYCEERKCGVRERMALFRKVCEAVQHAHEHGIIHRDLKPSNIFVKADGSVRLLDFGIAKQLDAAAAGFRTTGQTPAPMTLRYAAPEQVSGQVAGTHTDVYALGVTLYELLTGQTPLELTGLTPGRVETAILTQAPDRPSRVMQQQGQTRDSFSRDDWKDIDVLCATAMHKDAGQRYRSVEAFIRDLDHWLNHQRLDAQEDSFFYRARKFAARNRRPLAIALILAVTAVSATVWFTWNLARARDEAVREQRRTQQVEQFVFSLFGSYDPDAGPGRNETVFTLLDRGRKEASTLSKDPALQADLYEVLSNLYHRLGRFEDAGQLLLAALALRREEDGQALGVGRDVMSLAVIRAEQSKFSEAEKLVEDGLAGIRKAKDASKLEVAGAEADGGQVFYLASKFNESVAMLEQALQIQTSNGAPEGDVAKTLSYLANAKQEAGNYDQAMELNRRALAICKQVYGSEHPRVADILEAMGAVRQLQLRMPEAESYYRQALAMYRKWYGNEHPKVAETMIVLGQALMYEKRSSEARTTLAEGLSVATRVLGEKSAQFVLADMVVANLDQQAGKLEEAEYYFRQTIEHCKSVYGAESPNVGIAMANLAGLEYAKKNYGESEELERSALKTLSLSEPPGHPDIAKVHRNLGKTLLAEHKNAEAAAELRTALDVYRKSVGIPAELMESTKAMLAQATGK